MESKNISTIIISKVEEFFYDDDMSTQITEWGKKYCNAFDSKNPQEEEQPIGNMNIFKEYCELIEKLLTNCIQSNGYNDKQLNHAINEEYDNMKQKNAAFASILLSYTDYFAFYELMHDINQGGEAIFCPALIECESEYESNMNSNSNSNSNMDSKDSDYKNSSNNSNNNSNSTTNYENQPDVKSNGNEYEYDGDSNYSHK